MSELKSAPFGSRQGLSSNSLELLGKVVPALVGAAAARFGALSNGHVPW